MWQCIVQRGINMNKKIFVSYKYGDTNVAPLKSLFEELLEPTKVRDYVNKLQDVIGENNINKGEDDGEDLSDFKDETIESKLRDKIYDSSITIVIISPCMKEYKSESDQWIPWEISYSLREKTRNDRTSYTNAVLAVVLPNKDGSYDYFLTNRHCQENCSCRFLHTDKLFSILRKNMFNSKNLNMKDCSVGDSVYTGNPSYINSIKWNDFIESPETYIKSSLNIRDNIDDYDICKQI